MGHNKTLLDLKLATNSVVNEIKMAREMEKSKQKAEIKEIQQLLQPDTNVRG